MQRKILWNNPKLRKKIMEVASLKKITAEAQISKIDLHLKKSSFRI